MRVLYVHQHFTTPLGASGTRSFAFAQQLISRGHEVTILCGSTELGDTGLTGPFVRGRREGWYAGIHIIELKICYSNYDSLLARTYKFLRFAGGSIKLALTLEFDLIFCTSTPLTVALPGIAASFLRSKPFVFEVRDLWPDVPQAMGLKNPFVLGLLRGLEWLSYRSARRCIGLSPSMVDGIRRRGVPSRRVYLIPNSCDLDLFSPADRHNRPTLPSVGKDDFLAVFMGAHGIANGLETVVEAARLLQEDGRHGVKLLLIGDGARKPALQALAASYSLHNLLFRDPLPKRELAVVTRRADVGLMIFANVPALFGTSPNKFFDYIALGLPVINNYPGWIAQMIERERCGTVVSPDDPAALADAIARLADDRAQATIMGQRARALAEREFDRRRLGDRFVDCLELALVEAA